MIEQNIVVQNQYLTFTLGKEKYGINILNTKEVLEATVLTTVPRMPDFMCGVINLRGSVVPVIDLKIKFKMENQEENQRNNIIVTEIDDLNENQGTLTIGIFTDSVQKVETIEQQNIEPPPKIGIPIDTEFIIGMGQINNEFVMLLNINKILNSSELNSIKEESSEILE
ncbi:MAG: chemotaxis protein CheW [Spirochaetaceae bacterium]